MREVKNLTKLSITSDNISPPPLSLKIKIFSDGRFSKKQLY